MIMRTLLLLLISASRCWAATESRREAEYLVAAYANHYRVPVEFARAVVEQESRWRNCAVSRKGAAGLMQLMPATASWLHVENRCNINQNISGGVRYLAWLMIKFHRDLRLVAAAYYAGETAIQLRGLNYSKPAAVIYVISVRQRYQRQKRLRSAIVKSVRGRRR